MAVTDQHTDLVAGLNADATQVTGSTAYDPFGTETATNGTTPAVGYQSGYTDPATGDVNMAARWYQPGTGSFASRDTWQLDPSPSAQANRYAYANDDPVNGTDPTGHVCACGGGSMYSSRLVGSGVRGVGRSGRAYDIAPKGHTGRSPSSRTRTSTSGGRSTSISRAQARRNQMELQRIETTRYSVRPSTRTGAGRGGGGHRVCTYGCTTYSPYRGSATTRSGSGTTRTGTTRPPKPPTPQNPNRGKNPTPAPTRPAPKLRVDVAGIQQRSLDRAVVIDQQAVIKQAVGGHDASYNPGDVEIAADYDKSLYITPEKQDELQLAGSSPVNRTGCAKGNSAVHYMPLDEHGRAQGVRACLNAGDFNYVNAKGDWAFGTDPTLIIGSGTEFPLDKQNTSWKHQPRGWRKGMDRGHLLAASLGGSGEDLRNLVPLFPQANRTVMKRYEALLAGRLEAGETIYYSVTPEYAGNDPVPIRIHLGWIGSRGGPGYAEVRNTR